MNERLDPREADAGRKIERFLADRLGAGSAHVNKLLRQGRVRCGERTLARGDRVEAGRSLELLPASGARPAPLPNRKLRLRVLHEDPDVIGILKPAPLAMHPGPGHGSDTLLNALVGRYPELLGLGSEREYGLVHRLDLETSGVLLVGRSVAGYGGLVEAFSQRQVAKEYMALVHGAPPKESGEVDAPVDGKEALTRYEIVERAGAVSWLRVRPLSGRKHQIRIHLSGLGCPVLADRRHGRGLDELTAQLYLGRLALHARSLSLTHPVSHEPLELMSEPPASFRKAWKRAQRIAGT